MGLVTAFLIPVLFLLVGGVGKKVVRGKGWKRRDFFLGVDAVLASLSAALIHASDLFLSVSRGQGPNGEGQRFAGSSLVTLGDAATTPAEEMVKTLVFIVGSILVYLALLGLHQDWETRNRNHFAQRFCLLGISNAAGIGLLLFFVYFLKGFR